jgi:hypothetical protein
MTLLYLDFDGVLHPLETPALDDDFRLIDNPDLFQWTPLLATTLVDFPDVQIVVSSDWRRLFDNGALVRLLGPLGSRFVGVVDIIDQDRSEEIRRDAAARRAKCWLALDDHPTVQVAAQTDPRFIVCDPKLGISEPRILAALRQRLEI